MSETFTLDAAMIESFAAIAANLDGGRFAHLAKDESVKNAARAIVEPARAERRRKNAAIRQATKREKAAREKAMRANWLAEWRDYSGESAARIDEVFRLFAETPKRSLIRRIAKRILRTHPESGIVCTDGANCYCTDCLPMTEWRDIVRAYAKGQKAIREVGAFAISRADMTADSGSRFYRNVVKHWHNYAGGKHVSVHGVTPDDILQDALLTAIESGDVDQDNVPTFGAMYGHTRAAVESAVFRYRALSNVHSENVSDWTWSDWLKWARENDGTDRLAYSTLPEWQAFEAAREFETAREKREAGIRELRETERHSLSVAHAEIARLIMDEGIPVWRIAKVLGRDQESLIRSVERQRTEARRWV